MELNSNFTLDKMDADGYGEGMENDLELLKLSARELRLDCHSLTKLSNSVRLLLRIEIEREEQREFAESVLAEADENGD